MLFGFTVISATLIATVFLVLSWVLRLNRKLGGRVAKAWAQSLLLASAVKIDIHNIEQINSEDSYIFVSNHLSHFDSLAIALTLPPNKLRFLAKRELFSIPFFGWSLSLVGYIPVERSPQGRGGRPVTSHAERALAEGFSLLFFAEGSRSRDGRIHPFRPGALRLARKTSIPIVPVGIRGGQEILPRGEWFPRRGIITICYGKPIPPDELEEEFNEALEDLRSRVAALSRQELTPRSNNL